ncbi:MAG: 2-polyprenyl-3-methyl-5-hydroxy-6-metoxy-1,4-benzoquinol methylase [Phenylobacterium sp.]|jgi:2-polyprenyl-3-methyl-5-hydroxy-6-metoxy-1,4-benzoquinol methylase
MAGQLIRVNKMIERLEVPAHLHRNAVSVQAAGPENTGQVLIDLVTEKVGLQSLENIDFLDVGCGVRFCMTIINRDIAIKSYTGIEIHQPIIDFLKQQVEPFDQRFSFSHWNVYNQMYNQQGVDITSQTNLPVDGEFDVMCLISVFTHLIPQDSLALLKLMRQRIRPGGKLFFSTYIDDELDQLDEPFDDRVPGKPLQHAYYGRQYMSSLITQAGWQIEAFYDKELDKYIQHYVVCTPV